MREYSMPPLAEIPASANLADMVTRRAAEQPQAVSLRRKNSAGGWDDITTSQLRDDLGARGRGLTAAGLGPGAAAREMPRRAPTPALAATP